MGSSKYFRFIGYFLLVCLVIIVVILAVHFIQDLIVLIENRVHSGAIAYTIFRFIGIIILLAVFGPAVGLLFISHANLMDEKNTRYRPLNFVKAVQKQAETNGSTNKNIGSGANESLQILKTPGKFENYLADVVLIFDTTVSNTDDRIIKKGTHGKIVAAEGDYVIVDFNVGGSIIRSKVYENFIK